MQDDEFGYAICVQIGGRVRLHIRHPAFTKYPPSRSPSPVVSIATISVPSAALVQRPFRPSIPTNAVSSRPSPVKSATTVDTSHSGSPIPMSIVFESAAFGKFEADP